MYKICPQKGGVVRLLRPPPPPPPLPTPLIRETIMPPDLVEGERLARDERAADVGGLPAVQLGPVVGPQPGLKGRVEGCG